MMIVISLQRIIIELLLKYKQLTGSKMDIIMQHQVRLVFKTIEEQLNTDHLINTLCTKPSSSVCLPKVSTRIVFSKENRQRSEF